MVKFQTDSIHLPPIKTSRGDRRRCWEGVRGYRRGNVSRSKHTQTLSCMRAEGRLAGFRLRAELKLTPGKLWNRRLVVLTRRYIIS